MRRIAIALLMLAVCSPALAQRIKLTAPTIFDISLTGNDANVAYQCSMMNPCRTLQAVMDWLFANVDAATQPVAIQLECGPGGSVATYAGGGWRGELVGHYGSPSIAYPPPNFVSTFTVQGPASCPPTYNGAGTLLSGVIIDGSLNAGGPAPAISTLVNKSTHIHNIVVKAPSDRPCIAVGLLSEFVVHQVGFNGCSDGISAGNNSTIIIGCPCVVTGSFQHLIYADLLTTITTFGNVNISMQGTVSFGDFAVGAARGSRISCGSGPFVFSYGGGAVVTGQKWRTLGAVIQNDCGAHLDAVFPGSAPGANLPDPIGVN